MNMFSFFKKEEEQVAKTGPSFEIELTASVLAYEIARIDGDVSKDELDVLMEEIKKISHKVGKKEEELLNIIQIYSNDSVSFYEFVEDINKDYTRDQKLSLLDFMWKIAYADGKLDVDEEKIIRRLANLIKLKDIDVLRLKDKAKINTL